MPEVVAARDRKRVEEAKQKIPRGPANTTPDPAEEMSNRTTFPANDDRKARIVTSRSKRGRLGEVEDLTPEEHQRRGDAADALFRELVRRATGKP
ncbi:MAG TPA: hypothetical protein VE218_12165 [Acidobacteriaceae bacterium]|nr:hypothetical protein [Acidobacteriaceae bacterium]